MKSECEPTVYTYSYGNNDCKLDRKAMLFDMGRKTGPCACLVSCSSHKYWWKHVGTSALPSCGSFSFTWTGP